MILKLGQPFQELNKFKSRKRVVRAIRMREDFMFETGCGWQEGKRGEWLVLAADLWSVVEDTQFHKLYEVLQEVAPHG